MTPKMVGLVAILGASMLSTAPLPAQGAGQAARRRAILEQRFRARGEEVVRKRLNLTNDQMNRLRVVNQQLDGRRRSLQQQGRETRLALRAELAKGQGADQTKVAQLMARAQDLQRQHYELQQEEARQLSAFLTPVQQAQYLGLEEQLRKRMREMQQAGADQAPPPEGQ